MLPPQNVSPTVDKAINTNWFEKGDWPSQNWWCMFNDSTLEKVIINVLNHNPTLAAALMNTKKVFNDACVVGSILYPQVDLNHSVSWIRFSEQNLYRYPLAAFPQDVGNLLPKNLYLLLMGLDLSYELDIWGKNCNIYKAALGEAKANAAETMTLNLEMSVTAAKGYFDLQAALQVENLLIEKKKAVEELLFLKKSLYKSGLNEQQTVQEFMALLATVDQELITASEQTIILKHFLRTMMGVGPDCEMGLDNLCASFLGKFPLPECLSLNLLARRPDVTTKIWEVEKSAHLVGAAKALFYPDINIKLFAGFESFQWNNIFDRSSFASVCTPAIHLPIFSGGRTNANFRARKADFQKTVYEYNETILRAAREVADMITEVESGGKRLKKQEEIVQEIKKVYALNSLQFQNSLINKIQLLETELELIIVKIAEVNSNKDYLNKLAGLIKALGGGFEDFSNVTPNMIQNYGCCQNPQF
jgi:NodT family efflux transporter outer membrane factor (OMF) lipoprotein